MIKAIATGLLLATTSAHSVSGYSDDLAPSAVAPEYQIGASIDYVPTAQESRQISSLRSGFRAFHGSGPDKNEIANILHFAAQRGQLALVKYLMSGEIPSRSKPSESQVRNALDEARANHQETVVAYMESVMKIIYMPERQPPETHGGMTFDQWAYN